MPEAPHIFGAKYCWSDAAPSSRLVPIPSRQISRSDVVGVDRRHKFLANLQTVTPKTWQGTTISKSCVKDWWHSNLNQTISICCTIPSTTKILALHTYMYLQGVSPFSNCTCPKAHLTTEEGLSHYFMTYIQDSNEKAVQWLTWDWMFSWAK